MNRIDGENRDLVLVSIEGSHKDWGQRKVNQSLPIKLIYIWMQILVLHQ